MSELLKRLEVKKRYSYSSHTHEVNWDDIVDIVEDYDQPQLNENQQIVLDYLKEIAKEGVSPMLGMEFLKYELGQNEYSGFRASAVGGAFYEFNNKEEAQVLQAFSQWALEQEED